MAISRRGFLQATLVAAPLIPGLRRRAGAAVFGRPLLLVCDGLTASTDARHLRAFLDPIAALKLKLGLVLGGGAQDLTPLAEACRGTDPELVEWIIDQPSILEDSAYFQMRQASMAQNGFAAFRALGGAGAADWGNCLTLACRRPAGAVPALNGVRAAGFRNVLLRPAVDTPIDCWTTDNGVLQLVGGRRASLSYLEPLFVALTDAADTTDPLVVYLALDELAGFSETTLSTIGGTLAELVAAGMDDGTIWPMRPSEFHLERFGAARLLGLHFELAAGADATLPSIMKTLAAVGVPFSVSSVADGDAAAACMLLPSAPTDADWRRLKSVLAGALGAGREGLTAPQTCILSESRAPDMAAAIAETGAAVVTSIGAAPAPMVGLDDAGLLHIPASVELGGSATAFEPRRADVALYHGNGRLRDGLIVVQVDAANAPPTPLADNWLLNLTDGEESVAVGLPALARGIAPVDPVFELLKRATAEVFVDGAQTGTTDAAERDRLLEDAQLAWRYFERLSDRRTGLVLSSAQTDGTNLVAYPLVTMWEIGSQILATVSALRIGLIDEPAFSVQIARLLKSVPAGKIDGMVLPQASVSAHGEPQAATRFSASDTGRLLVALKVLEQAFDMKKEVTRILARWDLAKVIGGRRLHNVENGRLTEYANSNYVDYTARAFALFGLETQSPYDVGTAEMGTDRQMRLLNRVADLGPIATEPHVLEELELGHSEASRLIAELLFTAQLGAAEATGKLFCVSEAPLDRAPWFTYQGFRLGKDPEPWTVDTKLHSPAYQAEAARAAVRLISTKGAFAWAAVRPHPYSSKLLATVRADARIPDLGFASGIYAATGKPTRNYSDTNTNAVILESIAYVLSEGRPALKPL